MQLKNVSRTQIARLQHYAAGHSQSKWNNYYSRCRLTSTSLAANAYTIAAGVTVQAFGYSRNGVDMAPAGLPGTLSTVADTNILTPNQTVSSEAVVIQGIGVILLEQSDANFSKQLLQNVSVKIRLNGNTEYLLGIPQMVPGPGGLVGSSESFSVAPSLADQLSRNVGTLNNGVPKADNFMPLPEPMIWASAGRGDSAFAIEFKVERATTTIAQYGSAARAAGAGVAPYTPPTIAQVFADFMVVLVGCTLNQLSSY